MIIKKILFLSTIFLSVFQLLCAESLQEQFEEKGYIEIYDQTYNAAAFDMLYQQFDEFIVFLQEHPVWVQNLYKVKERFIRSKDRDLYSSDMCGFYDESKKIERSQVSFYYSTHFHACICSCYPEINQIPELACFLQTCYEIQKPYEQIFNQATKQLGLDDIFILNNGTSPIILKVITYLPSYSPSQPHYDGTALTLFLDSTDNQSLLVAPYASLLSADDFYAPVRKFSRWDSQRSMLLVPGTLLTEFSIYPTPHIVIHSGKVRYATIAFAMRPHYISEKIQLSQLPDFKKVE